jgi:alkylation response protein AidB-like acyl-CoA dehydrogenase
MDFKLTEEQSQLKDTLTRFVQKEYAFEKRREIIKSKQGWSTEVWGKLTEMGLTAIGIPEEHGGLGGGAFDTLVVMEAFGRGLVVEPYLATVVLGAGAIQRAGSASQLALLEKVASGELKLALAHYEGGARYDLNHVAASAKKDGAGYKLSGAKTVVLHGDAADKLVVSARTSGKERDASGVTLFLVDARTPGVSIHGYPTFDGQRAAEVTLKDVSVGADAVLGTVDQGLPIVEQVIEAGIAAQLAEALGAMSAIIELTLSYIKTRKQFGVPIGAFQVLQHRMADMLMHAEQARSMAYLAAAKIAVKDAEERRRAISAAKVIVGQAARYVGQQAVQLHGGIGVTDELATSHYFKRLTLITQTFGDTDHHLAKVSDRIAVEAQAKAVAPKLKLA